MESTVTNEDVVSKTKRKRKPGNTTCCVPNCSSKKKECGNLSWHSFPTDPAIKHEWIKRVNRQSLDGTSFELWKPTKKSKICGSHFNTSGVKGRDDILPRLNLSKTYNEDDDAKVLQNYQKNKKTRKPRQPIFIQESESPNLETFSTHTDSPALVNLLNESYKSNSEDLEFDTCGIDLMLEKEQLCKDLATSKKYIYDLKKDNIEIMKILDQKNDKIEDLQKQCDELTDMLKESLNENNILKSKDFSYDTILKDKNKLQFYTGFKLPEEYKAFEDHVLEVYNDSMGINDEEKKKGRPFKLSVREQIFAVEVRMRSGFLAEDLGFRMDVSESCVSRIWNYWVPILSQILRQTPIWLDRATVTDTMPQEFKLEYPSCRLILDATELFAESPSDFTLQSEFFSQYKKHTTLKENVGIAPCSFITHVSDLVVGNTTDNDLTEDSGLLEKLEPGDSVMADRGFTLKDKLEAKGVGLNIPSFMHGRPQLPPEEEEESRKIAHFRIHVERVIREIKKFRILKFVFPISMWDNVNDVWHICCHLVNFIEQPLLLRNNSAV